VFTLIPPFMKAKLGLFVLFKRGRLNKLSYLESVAVVTVLLPTTRRTVEFCKELNIVTIVSFLSDVK